jgi:hypothetical protein
LAETGALKLQARLEELTVWIVRVEGLEKELDIWLRYAGQKEELRATFMHGAPFSLLFQNER